MIDRLFLVITGNCNARCSLCHYWKQTRKRHLPLEFISDRVAPLIHGYNIRLVILTGGEPTLHPRLPDIIRTLKQSGAQLSLVTNGTRLEPVFPQIRDFLDGYMFSLDAANPVLYKKIRGLDNFSALSKWPQRIRQDSPCSQAAYLCLVQKENIGDLANIYRLAESSGADALIFNTPELKPHCFAHHRETMMEYRKSAILTPAELERLKENFEEIGALDQGRGLLFQGPEFFGNCLRYFEALAQGRQYPFNDPASLCRIPFDTMVIDENRRLRPCFYLPGSAPLEIGLDDPLNSEPLKALRGEIAGEQAFREKHCSFCLQFKS